MAEANTGPSTQNGGTTAADLGVLREIGSGLSDLSRQLGDALRAVDQVPLETVAQVIGPIGGEFAAALMAATSRHRQVLEKLAHTSHAAGELVLATSRAYAHTEQATARAVSAASDLKGA